MRKTAMSILVFSMLCCSTSGWAAGQMKAGLWEMSMKSDAIKSMPKMSPQQMEQMRKMGVNIPQMQDGMMVTKVCISKEMAERDRPPEMHHDQTGCESKNFQRSGTSYSVDIVCDGPRMKGTGVAKGAFSNGGSLISSTYDFSGTAEGRPVNQHHETSGKWLGADCGDVKSMDQFMPKK